MSRRGRVVLMTGGEGSQSWLAAHAGLYRPSSYAT